MKQEGYNAVQTAKIMGVSAKTVRRLLHVNPDLMCIDGSKTRSTGKMFDPYRKQIQELIECGFKNTQIMSKLKAMFPRLNPKRTTLDDYCRQVREEIFEYVPIPATGIPEVCSRSVLALHLSKINLMHDEGKPITEIFAAIQEDGFTGSYSLLQQYCLKIAPASWKKKTNSRKIKRTDIVGAAWSGYNENLTQQDIAYIEETYPVYKEITDIFCEFRLAYSAKDVDSVQLWCEKYAQCRFPSVCSFINGIATDKDAFYNSLKYSYSNGVLEGKVNKLKEVKRSMYGRASYALLRSKMLLAEAV